MGLIGTQIGNSDNTTTAQIRAAVLTTTITNGDTTHAPDGNAVYDALQLKGDSQTAATQVARLALTSLTRGARVYQTDTGFWYELTNAAAPSDAASWQGIPKRYIALLTQSGNGTSTATSGTLDIGKRYEITTYVAGDDFTNVGAASNATGVFFTATGTTPTVWTEGSTLTDTSAPVATVQENGLGGTVVWTRGGQGYYYGTLNGVFLSGKVFALSTLYGGLSSVLAVGVSRDTDNRVIVTTVNTSDGQQDDILTDASIEVLVYP